MLAAFFILYKHFYKFLHHREKQAGVCISLNCFIVRVHSTYIEWALRWHLCHFIGLAYQDKDIVFRFLIEYSSLMDFYRPLGNNRSISI
jgi:hypothetical protein